MKRTGLRTAAWVPESQLWTLAEPHRSRIARGFAWAAKTEPRESDIEALFKRADRVANPRPTRHPEASKMPR